jgi:hypothetical protein
MQEAWYNSLVVAAGQGAQEIIVFLPKILTALLILLIGAGVAKLLRKGVIKFFEAIKVSTAVQNTPIEHFLKNAELTTKLEEIFGSLVYWLLMLIVVHTAVSVLGLTSLSFILERILVYLPHIISSVIILFIGILLSGLVESLVKGSIRSIDGKSARLLGKISSYLVLVLTVMMAVSELGIATEFIKILFIGFVGFLTLALGLSFGLGGQYVVRKILEEWHTNFSKQVKE